MPLEWLQQDRALVAACIELSHTPRMPRRHAKVARKLLERLEVDKDDYHLRWFEAPDSLERALNHLICGGIPRQHIEALYAMIFG
jgi:hypothetical protein